MTSGKEITWSLSAKPLSSLTISCFLGSTISNNLRWENNVDYEEGPTTTLCLSWKSLAQVGTFWSTFTRHRLTAYWQSWPLSVMAASPRSRKFDSWAVCAVSRTIGCDLPHVSSIYTHCSLCRAHQIVSDVSHSAMTCSVTCPLRLGIDMCRPEFPSWKAVSLLKQ